MKSNKGAMEMSVGTIVTIVLLMSVLVLGIFMVRQIFTTGTTAIDGIDEKIQGEIDNLFSVEGKSVVIYPKNRFIRMSQGDTGGFGFSIKNKDMDSGTFAYELTVGDITEECTISEEAARRLIVLHRKGDGIKLPSGTSMEEAVFVRFKIPENTPLCLLSYNLDITKDGELYAPTIAIDLEIM
jgi:hypothetical protein